MLKAAPKRERLDIASANLWLAQGAPIADVLTMLEARHRFEFSSADCRAYATEILWAAQQQIHTTKPNLKPHRKEPHHAAA
jgi:hypothetical protein